MTIISKEKQKIDKYTHIDGLKPLFLLRNKLANNAYKKITKETGQTNSANAHLKAAIWI